MGALGPVFRTYEPTRDRLVAVKVFRLDVIPEQAQALADELAHATEAELFHPSIVEPIAAGVEGTVAYRAEEYVAAESLDVAMRHYAPASFDTMMRIVGQLAAAIDAARAAGVGHGALHPRDIFVTPDDARASGFGVVEALERVGLRAPVRRPYSAPERIAGAAWSTPADVFSLGVIAFELLTGRRPVGTGVEIGPLTGATASNLPRLQAVLVQAMDEQAGDRFASGRAFTDALTAAADLTIALPAAVAAAAAVTANIADLTAFPDEPLPPSHALAPADIGAMSIEMIGIPPEAAVFAEEEAPAPSPLAAEVPLAAGALDDSSPTAHVEPPLAIDHGVDDAAVLTPDLAADIAVEQDEDAAHWALTEEEDTTARSADEPPSAGAAGRYADIDVEAAADALIFDAADLTLNQSSRSGVADDFSRGDAGGYDAFERDPEPTTDAGIGLIGAPTPTGLAPFEAASGTPSQVIERVDRRPSSEDEDFRGPFEQTQGTGERSRRSFVPLAMMLLVGLLVGSAAVYFARPGRQAPPAVETSAPAPSPAVIEPVDGPAVSRGDPPKPVARPTAPSAAGRAVVPPPAARSGTLIVRSTPAGAAVTINGKWSGRTPLTRRALAFGDYTVRVILPGYQARPEQVTLSADAASRTVAVQLQREPTRSTAPASAPSARSGTPPAVAKGTDPGAAAAGVIEVDSRPVGARVFVDDRNVGTTPVRVPELTPGSHVIRLELAGHRPWTEVAQVGRGRTTRVAGSLEPIR